ncbi:nucleoside recognition domain-containing protein [Croceibacterium ferulae]|uniref:nucleoside recognition domain-containing protein n=1 Tax=Croceibacterium ferulae TaxID=1854641 RepID=UPI0019D4615D|nr:nucleoside recognition domain-containing protein [Croceibacterium ferulae]
MIDVILQAGRITLDVVLYTLLPIMVVLMIVMRILEVYGILDKLVTWLTPVTRPFGLPGLGAVALLQGSLVSFIAPLPTMKVMETRGLSNRHLGATLAGVLASAPANATFPLATLGLPIGITLTSSIVGGLVAAASTYWVFGRGLSLERHEPEAVEKFFAKRPSLLTLINKAGGEGVHLMLGLIPMLLLSLVVVVGLQAVGAIGWLVTALRPNLSAAGIDEMFVLPAITKYLAGNTAFVGLIHEAAKQPGFNPGLLWKGAGFLIHPLDLPGVAVLTSSGPRLLSTLWPALAGAVIGITLRGIASALFG